MLVNEVFSATEDKHATEEATPSYNNTRTSRMLRSLSGSTIYDNNTNATEEPTTSSGITAFAAATVACGVLGLWAWSLAKRR